MRRWLRNTAVFAVLAVVAMLVLKLAQPYLVDGPVAPPEKVMDDDAG